MHLAPPPFSNTETKNSIKKIALIFMLFTLYTTTQAQTKIIHLLSKETKTPIPNAYIFNRQKSKGTVSNLEGKVILSKTMKDSLTLSHLSYISKKIFPPSLSPHDTVYLERKVNSLQKVVITDFDFAAHLKNVRDNYKKFYYTRPKNYHCTLKSILRIDQELARLSQVQLLWWDRSYKYHFKLHPVENGQIKLKAIDYSKIITDNRLIGNWIFSKNSTFLKQAHLNNILTVLWRNRQHLKIKDVERHADFTKILFEGPLRYKDRVLGYLKSAYLLFAHPSGAIIKLNLNIAQQQRKKGLYRGNKSYFLITTQRNLSLQLSKNIKDKYALTSYIVKNTGTLAYQGTVKNIQFEKKLFVTRVSKGKRIPFNQRIRLRLPFFYNLPSQKKATPRIPLTTEERAFIRK